MLNATLYPFQEEAVERMVQRETLLLAMTMGAGKTVTAIAALEEMMRVGRVTRALIVVPAALKFQWQQEIHRFTDHMALVIDGTQAQRRVLYPVAEYYRYTIINYEALVNDRKRTSTLRELARELQFDAIVIDEATAIKSFRAKRTVAVKNVARKVTVRFALTGQPIENRPEDLFSIMQFVDDTVLGHFEIFDRTFIERDGYGRMVRARNLPLLKKKMTDSMVRKTRADIADQLPKVVETALPIEFSRPEARLYNVIKDRLLAKLIAASSTYGGKFNINANYGFDDPSMMKVQGEVMSALLCLRMACDDPQLVIESAKRYVEGSGNGSLFARELLDEGLLDHLPASTKLKELNDIVDELMEADDENKVVIFSTFKGMLRSISSRLSVGHVMYNGDMNARQKDAAKQQFQRDPNTRLFLSSDAGGYGVNLSEANYLISADLPWSTGKFEQRESRIIRISTEFDHVTLISTIIKGSIEQRIHDMLTQKKGVADAFLDGGYDQKGRFELTLSSLTQFLEESTV